MAAGEGTRMHSSRPKPLHPLCGRPMLLHILDALAGLAPHRTVVVVGHGGDQVTKALVDEGPAALTVAEQPVRRGTGDAVMAALTAFGDDDLAFGDAEGGDDGGDVVVVPGDAPLLRPATLAELVAVHRRSGAAATLLSTRPLDPHGYGRVVRGGDGDVRRIVEELDASPEEVAIDEVATSVYCFRRSLLTPALRRITPDNRRGEYYLTDVIAVLARAGHPVGSVVVDDPVEAMGVNDRAQLAEAEAELQRRINQGWLTRGVTMVDPTCTYIDARVRLAADVTLLPGTMLAGGTEVGEGSEIGPATRLTDCVVGAGAIVANSVGIGAEVGAGARVGPFASVGPGSVIPAGAVTGPFYTA
ncbi:MAG TPA: NTP transferase domain-containing protein [Acidimicrobiales bacterium]|nr:NTP transferase domain-containing protein [Acidimicrobiales bacterium]